ncbi:MAG TPA: hypothetical protein VND45_09510 [Thermoanaerobaculia bacterium]|jgi:hypothetical protein|nr:hypothetical protein [Thermoanaerobaculia bacterium]
MLLPFILVLAAMQHDITRVEPVAPDAAIATPVPERQQRNLKKYDMPELAGAKQALGPQLIDGRLPKPIADYVINEGTIEQRISLFEGGLVVVKMTGAASIQKKVIIPADALGQYVRTINAAALQGIDARELIVPDSRDRALLRVYDEAGKRVERVFHPNRVLPKTLNDQIAPLRDLLRAISEDRGVTTSMAGYEPRPGDELVADDHKIYRVVRVQEGSQVVELRCLSAPSTVYVVKKDLYLYFLGAKPKE